MRGEIRTDVGHVRSVNEDSLAIIQLEGLTLAVVADGMGGHSAGEVASQMAVNRLSERVRASIHQGMDAQEGGQRLLEAIQASNREVYRKGQEETRYRGMGTTLVCLLLAPKWGWLAHIGDSRAYRFRDGCLTQLTRDHSLVNELLQRGQITQEEAIRHPQRHVLMRALGTEEEAEVELQPLSFQAGDVFLLCSDGLSSSVSEADMEEVLSRSISLKEKADALLEQALACGGEDNVSFVLLSIPSPSGEDP